MKCNICHKKKSFFELHRIITPKRYVMYKELGISKPPVQYLCEDCLGWNEGKKNKPIQVGEVTHIVITKGIVL